MRTCMREGIHACIHECMRVVQIPKRRPCRSKQPVCLLVKEGKTAARLSSKGARLSLDFQVTIMCGTLRYRVTDLGCRA